MGGGKAGSNPVRCAAWPWLQWPQDLCTCMQDSETTTQGLSLHIILREFLPIGASRPPTFMFAARGNSYDAHMPTYSFSLSGTYLPGLTSFLSLRVDRLGHTTGGGL